MFTWTVRPLGADGPPYFPRSAVALGLVLQAGGLVQTPLVDRGPEQTLRGHVGVDVLEYNSDIISF